MSTPRLIILITLLLSISTICAAQLDSTLEALQKIPVKYLSSVENKIDKYTNRITGKTEKTLTKLARWEGKIKTLLEQVSPETANKLFGNNQLTFSGALQKIQEGKAIAEGYRAKYNEYRDKLTTSLKYLEQQKDNLDKKYIQPINAARQKLDELEKDLSTTEAVEKFIKERRRQLMDEAVKYLGKSKYLTKIDKEAYYYIETLRNYKELFSDRKKAEDLALKILNKIPAFKKFVQQNSMLASLFRLPSGNGGGYSPQDLAGLQTRESINALIQDRLAAGGPNSSQAFSQNMQRAQAQLNQLKNQVLKAGGGSSTDANIPNFKPNSQRSKTFLQRLDFGSNFQFGKNNSLVPGTADIALSVGYKLNDKSIVGVGASYKMGFGSIRRLNISHQGIGLRSFIDWKAKKQFFVSGGFEMNYNAQFKKISQLKSYDDWQPAGLIGITKKLNIKTKYFKGTSVQLLYDFLYRQHVPVSQPFLFRVGYSFK